MKSLKVGITTATIVALIIGMGLVLQDRTHFFVLYYTIALPIALTAGALAFFISLAYKAIKSSSGTSNKEEQR